MRDEKRITKAGQYATTDDFRRIFDENMNSLFLLAFLLTADHGRAEQCFVSGLDDAVVGNPVFKEWARSWARRAIIQKAVRLINPRPDNEVAVRDLILWMRLQNTTGRAARGDFGSSWIGTLRAHCVRNDGSRALF